MPEAMESPSRPPLWAFLIATVSFGAIGVTFVQQVQHWNFLGDDSFISFRYSKHLVDGLGLVWNPGERVEGYTNFLWVLMMAAGMRMDLEPEWLSRAVGIASGAILILVMAGFFIRRHGLANPLVWTVPAVFATSRSYTAWCTSGLETMFYTLLLLTGTLLWLREHNRRSRFPWASALLFALASLTRPDGLLFAGLAGGLLFCSAVIRRRSFVAVGCWALLYSAIVGSHLLWRHHYYGYWLPNTFYAKVPGVWWEQGRHYLQLFDQYYRLSWFLPLALLPLVLRRDLASLFFALASASYLSYVAAVGGDRFEFRFLVVVFPFVYGLLGDGLAELWGRCRHGWMRCLRVLPLGIAVALVFTTWTGSHTKLNRKDRGSVAGIGGIRSYANNRIEQGVILQRAIQSGKLPPDVVLSVGGAGAIPYYTDWITIDFRGLNDEKIAHSPILKRRGIAHEHLAELSDLRERKVEILDAGNRLLHEDDCGVSRGHRMQHGQHPVNTRALRLGRHFLVFGTFLTDAQLRKRFDQLRLITPRSRRPRARDR